MKNQIKTNGSAHTPAESDGVIADANHTHSVKPYETPVLIAYGDVRDITLGGTLGMGESGAGFENFDVIRP